MKLDGYLYVTAGVLILALSGACTLNIMAQPGSWASLSVLPLMIGGGFVLTGLWLARTGLRLLRRGDGK